MLDENCQFWPGGYLLPARKTAALWQLSPHLLRIRIRIRFAFCAALFFAGGLELERLIHKVVGTDGWQCLKG